VQERPTLGSIGKPWHRARHRPIRKKSSRLRGEIREEEKRGGKTEFTRFKIGAGDLDGPVRGKTVSAEPLPEQRPLRRDLLLSKNPVRLRTCRTSRSRTSSTTVGLLGHTGFPDINPRPGTFHASRRCRGKLGTASVICDVFELDGRAPLSIFPTHGCLSRRSHARPSRCGFSTNSLRVRVLSLQRTPRPNELARRRNWAPTSSRSPKGITPAAWYGTRAAVRFP